MTEQKRLKPELEKIAGCFIYLDCHVVENTGENGSHVPQKCAVCGKENLNFIHTLENSLGSDDGPLEVCIKCARVLIGDVEWDIPGEAENELERKKLGN